MSSKINNLISAAYRILFDREPDIEGVEYWTERLDNGLSKDQFLRALVHSPEFKKCGAKWLTEDSPAMPVGMDVSHLIAKGLRIGHNCTIHFDTILDPPHCCHIEIGDNVTFAPGVHVLAHDGSTKSHLGFTEIKKVKIEDNVFLGAGSIILPGVVIGANSIVGAGSIVTKDVPPSTVVAGNPAVILCSLESFLEKHKCARNAEHI
jgi:maltose O-acetyltransferase